MATSITTNGKKKISTFKIEFSSKFPYLTIQFLDQKRKEYDNELNLVSIRTKKGDDISISGQNKINSLESKFEKTLGIAIEVCYSKNSKLIRTKSNNDKTLSELNKWCEANGCDLILTNKKVLKGKKSVATKSNGKKKVPILELQDIDLIISEIKALPVKSKIEVTSYKDSIEQWEEFYTIKVKKSIVELKVTRQFFDSYWRAVISRNDLISSLEIYKEEKDIATSFQFNWEFKEAGESFNEFDIELLDYDADALPSDCWENNDKNGEIDPYKIFANYTSKLEESETLVLGNINWVSASYELRELFKLTTGEITKVAKKAHKEKEVDVDVDELIRKMKLDFL
jgi:hypothetical protein